ncbi:hypothetical protein EV200_103553 [Pedobacter psychrotolerans]|uniref:MotA/TolQ/ExbB proton channel family protein n=1 Tax=Pedobacter psychrotolerans TaxID=1843235 RepID=A0A4R2HFC5_9SPHI|nr:hypothetical protein [Pedobacter psychrotolerans]TCO27219.1 hypothetical protein EV200_103553 [Pedobacter psychrotolerans]GGE59874.1 hypothetical protein GCM10011413_27900 [Pedobacter psychrotolerans]
MDSSISGFIFILINIISPFLVFIACCYYLFKRISADAILLFVGSGISLLLTGFYSFLMPYLARVNYLPAAEVNTYYSIAGIIGLIAGICFGIGLFILINSLLNTNKMLNKKS